MDVKEKQQVLMQNNGHTIYCQESEDNIIVSFHNTTSLSRSNARGVFQILTSKAKKGKKLSLNLSTINYIDSQGLAMLIHLSRVLKKANSQLIVQHPKNSIHKILGITQIDRILTVQSPNKNQQRKEKLSIKTFVPSSKP